MPRRELTEIESLAIQTALEARRTIRMDYPSVLFRAAKYIYVNNLGEIPRKEGEPRKVRVEVEFEFYGANIEPVLCTCILQHDNELGQWFPKMVLGEYGDTKLAVEFSLMGNITAPHVREGHVDVLNRQN